MGDDREGARIQEEQNEEQANGSDKDADIHEGGREHAPARRQVIAVQGCHDNDEALKPHTNVHHDGDQEGED